ncbi:MAG: hypothetical protein ACRECO_08660 [Xanthobacteraceae bacterium]
MVLSVELTDQHRVVAIPLEFTPKDVGAPLKMLAGKDYLSPADRKTLRKILEEAKDCTEIRNELAHGFYGTKKEREV